MKPFSKTELKILVYNKTKKGIPYDQAVREVKEELSTMNEIKRFDKAKKKSEKWTREQSQ